MRVEITEGPHQLQPGQYGKWQGTWYAQPPCEADLTANLTQHEVHEHADGSISVRPSIWVEGGALGTWHGFLWGGKWNPNPPAEGMSAWPTDERLSGENEVTGQVNKEGISSGVHTPGNSNGGKGDGRG